MSLYDCLHEFLSHLNAEERRRFDDAARTVWVAKGRTVINKGVRNTDVFFIDEGAFQVLVLSKKGKEVPFRTLRKGDCFGELAALDAQPRSADVIAATDGRLVRVDGEKFEALLESSPRASLWLSRFLASQVRALTKRVVELSTLNVQSRLHCELLRLGRDAGVEDNEACILPSPTHQELANRIGTVRELVSRELSALAKRGLIDRSRRELLIRDFAELSRLVESSMGEPSDAPWAEDSPVAADRLVPQ